MGLAGFNTNLTDQLAFYGAYHHNKWNQLIHLVFVPAIMWSAFVWAAYTGSLVPWDCSAHLHFLPHWLSSQVVLNQSAFALLFYWAYYIVLERFAGLTWGLFLGAPLWLTATWFTATVPHAWAWALGVHLFSWYAQIHLGHIVMEKRKPALLDSFFQSLVLAPLFVWLEFLFALGYRKEYQALLNKRIQADIAASKQQKQPLLQEQANSDGASAAVTTKA
eukprot:jgi/Astpho2/3132/Aster-03416